MWESSLGVPHMPGPAVGQLAWPGMLAGCASRVPPAAEMCPSPHVYQTGGCMEKPNCPALLTSPGDEREDTNSFAKLLRYLISSNCSWEDREKEQDSAADGGKGKRMVETGRKKGLGGMDGNPWVRVKAHMEKEGGRKGQQKNDGYKQQQKKAKPDKQRTGARNKGEEGKTKRATCCQAPQSSRGRRADGDESRSRPGPIPALQSQDVLGIVGNAAASSRDDTTGLEVVESLVCLVNE